MHFFYNKVYKIIISISLVYIINYVHSAGLEGEATVLEYLNLVFLFDYFLGLFFDLEITAEIKKLE